MARCTPGSNMRLWLRFASLGALLVGSSFGASGCVEDKVLPVDQVCGNLKKEGTEECDLADIGCVGCHIVPGFTCDDTKCTSTCGDGIVAAGAEDCDPPNLMTCDSSCHAGVKTEDCDMNGYWLARETAFSIDNLLSEVQTTSHWHVYHFSQVGDTFQVDKHIDCGVLVTGSATVQMTDKGVQNLMHANPMDTDSPRGPRKGTFKLVGTGCELTMDRQYNVRGALESVYLPTDFLAKPDLSTLPPLPYNPDPTTLADAGATLAGEVDEDQDGKPGVAFILSGPITGSRHTAQRDWVEIFTDPAALATPKALEFTVRTNFDDQENILLVDNCTGCGLLLVGAHPGSNMNNRVTLRYLGKDMTDPRVSRILTEDLKVSISADFQTCLNERASLPHDPSKQ